MSPIQDNCVNCIDRAIHELAAIGAVVVNCDNDAICEDIAESVNCVNQELSVVQTVYVDYVIWAGWAISLPCPIFSYW